MRGVLPPAYLHCACVGLDLDAAHICTRLCCNCAVALFTSENISSDAHNGPRNIHPPALPSKGCNQWLHPKAATITNHYQLAPSVTCSHRHCTSCLQLSPNESVSLCVVCAVACVPSLGGSSSPSKARCSCCVFTQPGRLITNSQPPSLTPNKGLYVVPEGAYDASDWQLWYYLSVSFACATAQVPPWPRIKPCLRLQRLQKACQHLSA